ncbi:MULTISPECIES: hypothetical protein [Streptomyces]|uniref:Uncharacterized protein n=1 Tax=Streptomyces cadmiisoli TaxID=2184053 RepID=A0A2Z4J2T4_9ACTN|nr:MULTISPECIES: hypothetical protein [Streptomyces]AWW39512.1 hypothetical protein DN051_24990 [Streptomyces cadmiisoli]KOV51877.1 hypothetical protein ADL00_39555 [Streptomyces sp. AS58]
MKSLKAAAVVFGSLIAAGAATPASALEVQSAPEQSAPDVAQTGLSGGVNTRVPLSIFGTGSNASLVHQAKEAATVVNDAKPVHGNLWL